MRRAARAVPECIVNNFLRKPLDKSPFVCYIILMKNESIYKVTLIDGPTTAILPIKAYDHDHAMRIANNMGLGRVVKVELSCKA